MSCLPYALNRDPRRFDRLLRQQDHQLVTAVTIRAVPGPELPRNRLRDDPQRLVASQLAMGGVVGAEPVEVHDGGGVAVSYSAGATRNNSDLATGADDPHARPARPTLGVRAVRAGRSLAERDLATTRRGLRPR